MVSRCSDLARAVRDLERRTLDWSYFIYHSLQLSVKEAISGQLSARDSSLNQSTIQPLNWLFTRYPSLITVFRPWTLDYGRLVFCHSSPFFDSRLVLLTLHRFSALHWFFSLITHHCLFLLSLSLGEGRG